jgi:hypothetical protein
MVSRPQAPNLLHGVHAPDLLYLRSIYARTYVHGVYEPDLPAWYLGT